MTDKGQKVAKNINRKEEGKQTTLNCSFRFEVGQC